MTLPFSRRQFLFGAGALGVLGAAYPLLRQLGDYAEPERPYRHLDARTATVFALLGDFLSPPGGPFPGSAGDPTTLERLDALLEAIPAETRRLLLALPLVFEHGTLVDRYGARRMSRLSPERRQAYLETWAHAEGVIRSQLFMAVRSIFGIVYFERPEVLTAMGIAPDCG